MLQQAQGQEARQAIYKLDRALFFSYSDELKVAPWLAALFDGFGV
jgi:hypothetical protein